jgi:glycosyltransferase involved in cell wall biosynthesis
MGLPKISILIPSYNKARFITATLKSIFDQKYKNIEVIIQDGGSTDGTLGIIKKYAKRYPIIWESKRDKGQLDAINKGLKKATGLVLTFINADDCYMPGAFAAISNAYTKNPNALWFAGRGIVINKNGKEIAKPVTLYKNLLLALNSYFLLLTLNYFMQPSVFITRKVWKQFGPFTGTADFITEYDFWLKLGAVAMPVVIGRNFSKFRIEQNTKTKTMSGPLLSEDWKIVNKYTKNPAILILHKLNNLGRILIGKFV